MVIKNYTIVLFVTLLFTSLIYSQTYQGPAIGSIDTGAVVNINTLADLPVDYADEDVKGKMNVFDPNPEPMIFESDGITILETTYIEDPFVSDNPNLIGDNTMLLDKVNLALANNVAPPDPTIAVGPNHVMVLTNNGTGIYIFDKEGNLLKSLSSTQWWSAVWPSQSGDPQILYDHFSNRWFMLFMQIDDVAQTAGNLIAYSDDDDPFGNWVMYRLDTRTHGTTPSNTWGDYPQIGFDEQAIYIMTRCFNFSGGLNYNKIRIIAKDELYASNAGPLTYTDIWDITLPGSSTRPDVIHPSFQFSAAGEHYFLWANRSGANIYGLYKLTNPLTAPTLTGVNISVPFYGLTPDAGQLGGSTAIATNGSHIKTAPVYRDGFLYATHSIRNSQFPNYASIKYVKIDVSTNSVVESAELGADGYYYFYPAIAVDADNNVGITCSRSGTDEYAGSFFMTRRASDPAGLSGAYTLQEGLANYVCSFCGTRNRWGDYLGIHLDPADNYSMWMVSEYAANSNTYAVSIGEIRLKPFDGVYVFPEEQEYDLGQVEVGFMSDTVETLIANYGTDDLVISSIPASVGDFSLVSSPSFPITLSTYDTILVKFVFNPTSTGQQNVPYNFTTNSAAFTGINLSGLGYEMVPASGQQLYGISGSQNNGEALTINKATGVGTNIGFTNFTDLIGMAIHPITNRIYAIRSSVGGSTLLRLNADQGDAYALYEFPLPELYSIAFDSGANLYGALRNGDLYQIDLSNGSYSLVTTIEAERISIRFSPQTNELWGTVKNFLGNPKDQLVKINLATGDTTRIGKTGFNVNTVDLAFDEAGVLFGVKGAGTIICDLFTIDQSTGTGTIVGSVGLKNITGLGYSPTVTAVENEILEIPSTYTLEQNYPNPFNPITQIKFSLPVNSNVKIVVYNLIGEVVRELVNTELSSGIHSVQWNSEDASGSKVSSGVYFYEIRASGIDGQQFNKVMKMVLLK